MMIQVRIGDEVVFDKTTYQVVAMHGTNVVLFNPEVSSDTAISIPITELEIPVNCLFEIGDIVRSRKNFLGTVIGFELDTNKVICRSRHYNDRIRYAYRANELLKMIVDEDGEIWEMEN